MNAGIPGQEVGNILLSVDLVTSDGALSVPAEDMGFHYRGASGLQSDSAIIGGSFLLEQKTRSDVNARVRSYLEQRSRSQPVNQPSCGSVFKNPPGDSSGRLIDEAGLKGAQKGNASISTKHANFIVTNKNASAEDVIALIDLARDRVLEATGVLLATEVRIVGVPRDSTGELR
jgi:UDP-N-acetylmuramate dehydrogenase